MGSGVIAMRRPRWRTSLLLLLLTVVFDCARVHFRVGTPLHLAFVRAHVRDRHRDPVVDPRERLTVTEQQDLANRLQREGNKQN